MTPWNRLIDEWERFTLRGDDYCQAKDYLNAYLSFENAAECIEQGFSHKAPASATAIRCWVLGCQNTAYCASRAKKRQVAEHYYRRCISRLARLQKSPRYRRLAELIELEWRQATLRYQQYLNGARNSPSTEQCVVSLTSPEPEKKGRWLSIWSKRENQTGRASFLFF